MMDTEAEGGGGEITVTELPDADAGGLFGSVLGVYERHGYDAGYRRALGDALMSLTLFAEELIRDRPGLTPDARRNVREIVRALEQEIRRRLAATPIAVEAGFESGAGI